MTPDIFKPLHNAIIWAQHCADPLIWREAMRRFDAADRALGGLPCRERLHLEERLYGMLPTESCHQSMSAMQRRALTH